MDVASSSGAGRSGTGGAYRDGGGGGNLMSQFQLEQKLQMMYSARKDLVATQDTQQGAALAQAVRETGRRRTRGRLLS